MPELSVRHLATAIFSLSAALMLSQSAAEAQLIRAPLTEGFARTSSIDMSVDEMLGPQKARAAGEAILGPGYPDLRIAEVQFKPVRLMRLPVTDPRTGETASELVWYLVYRVIPRDYTELAGDGRDDLLTKLSDPETDPANQLDPPRAMPLRMPRFLLVTSDSGEQVVYHDEVNLQVQEAVFRREMARRGTEDRILNSVSGIVELMAGDAVSVNDPDPLANAAYGVAIWRNVDPETDFFSVYMTGFSNAYRISQSPEGDVEVQEKVIHQKFARPGDQFLQDEQEFRLIDDEDVDGDGAPDLRFPRWEYRQRPATIDVPEFDSILRNAQAADETSDQ